MEEVKDRKRKTEVLEQNAQRLVNEKAAKRFGGSKFRIFQNLYLQTRMRHYNGTSFVVRSIKVRTAVAKKRFKLKINSFEAFGKG